MTTPPTARGATRLTAALLAGLAPAGRGMAAPAGRRTGGGRLARGDAT